MLQLQDQLELLDRQVATAEVHLAGLLDGELARRLVNEPFMDQPEAPDLRSA